MLAFAAQPSSAAAVKHFLALNQTPAGAAIAAEGDSVRLLGEAPGLEVSMEAIDDATGKDAVADGSAFQVFVTFNNDGQWSRVLAGEIVMNAGHADLMLSADAAEKGCTPNACGFIPEGFGAVENITRVEIVAGTILDANTEQPLVELAGQVVLDSADNAWNAR